MKARHLVLGLLVIGLILTASAPVQATGGGKGKGPIRPSGVGNPHVWDRSSLEFPGGASGNSNEITVTICNGAGSANMQCDSSWEVWYAEQGNPKRGAIIGSGTIPALASGECITISYTPNMNGNYMFKGYQVDGHPGTGSFWSDSIGVNGG